MAKKIIIGVDPASSKIALVAICGKEFIAKDYARLGKSGGVACANAWKYTHQFVSELPWDVTQYELHSFIEAPLVGRGGVRSTMVQCFTSGAVQGALSEQGFTTQVANVSSWKKSVIGKGNATKPEVAEYIRCYHPKLFESARGNQDIIDASCIALFGAKLCG